MLCRQLLRRPLLLQKWRWRHHPLPALRALGVSPPSPYPGDTVDDLSHSPLLPAACIAQFIERTLGKMDRGQHAVDEWRRNRRDGVVSLDLANYAKQGKLTQSSHLLSTAALKFSQRMGQKREVLAEELREALTMNAEDLHITDVAVLPSGHLSIRLHPSVLSFRVRTLALQSRPTHPATPYSSPLPPLVLPSSGNHSSAPISTLEARSLNLLRERACRKVVIDYASPNMAKELHAGHLRSIVIGEAIARCLRHVGHQVDGVSHTGDFGTPVGLVLGEIVASGREWQSLGSDSLSDIYINAKRRAETSPKFLQFAKEICVAKQYVATGEAKTRQNRLEYEGRACTVELITEGWDKICGLSRQGFEKVYNILGVNVDEKSELQEAGVLMEFEEGALGCQLPGWNSPMLLRKGDGGYLYATTDMAALYYRFQIAKYDWAIYVTDEGQGEHFRRVFEIGQRVGWLPHTARADHCPFGLMLHAGGGKISSRKGDGATLTSLIGSAIERAEQVLPTTTSILRAERVEGGTRHQEPSRGIVQDGPDSRMVVVAKRATEAAPVEWDQFSDPGKRLGVTCLRYYDLSHHRISNYEFDTTRMLSMKGNTAVYIMYAYTRIQSLLAKYSSLHQKAEGYFPEEVFSMNAKLESEEEELLAVAILRLDEQVLMVEAMLLPNLLCDYLYDVATRFHSFYEKCPILTADTSTSHARLQLCLATRITLQQGMYLLGLDTVDRL